MAAVKSKGNTELERHAYVILLTREKCKTTIFKLGVAEMTLGCISCVLCVGTIIGVTVSPRSDHVDSGTAITYVSTGLWSGAYLIACGVMGTRVCKIPPPRIFRKNKIMSIIGAILMGITVVMSITGALANSYRGDGVVVMHTMLTLVSAAAMIICVVHSVYCFVGMWLFAEKYYRRAAPYRSRRAGNSHLRSNRFSAPGYNKDWNKSYWEAMSSSVPPYPAVGYRCNFLPH